MCLFFFWLNATKIVRFYFGKGRRIKATSKRMQWTAQALNSPYTSLSTLQSKMELSVKSKVGPRRSRLFLLDWALFQSSAMEMMSAPLQVFYRHLRCQNQHDQNEFHLWENIDLFVYTTAEQSIIASRALIRVFPNIHWDTELEHVHIQTSRELNFEWGEGCRQT